MEFMYKYLAIAIIISFIPYVRSFFGTIHTLIHETGHALAALATSGKVYSISLYSTTDGIATTGSRSRFSSIIVAYAGYTFSSLFALLAFYLIANGHVLILFYLFFALALINLLLWVRNAFGLSWLLGYVIASAFLIYYQLSFIKEMITYILSSIILIQSMISSFIICFLSLSSTNQSNDANVLQKLTFIPSFVWGAVFLIQSFAATYYVILFFI
ncbi:M50 family metallopeptidase [Halalkalibacter akibai]|uniref:M50 family peptidase n=1 Tax=Halalkalibacter akibai (strain ATCC 43226 / DSM 21942 / CIP 109018 / JCM 9157 / 1139) TaxID=1236973 RepID=W4QW69_HALA3|nr:M50 family metallopeptidase [Halalkalibacter akibai]GAE36147.1 hypothetical protein JCM9157_3296 [Halalkalibacter akibai JCM 9157]